MENYTFRLKSAQDLFDSIESFIREKYIEAGGVSDRNVSGRRPPPGWSVPGNAGVWLQAAKSIRRQKLCWLCLKMPSISANLQKILVMMNW